MIEIKEYVDGLFRHQHLTPEVKDLKEEILSNMLAKRDDLISQGFDADSATEKAEESLSAIDYLIDGNQLTDIGKQKSCKNVKRGRKMSKKSKVIIGLLAIAVVLFCAIQFWIIPTNRAKEAEYARGQTDALTHDISVIETYRTPYIGNASNASGLFEVLPLSNISKNFEINSDNCTLTVNYLDTVWNIGEEKVQRDLIYNSVAAMAAIDNLSGIIYNFSGDSYSFERSQIEEVFGSPLSDLLEEKNWVEKVQDKLSSEEFCQGFYR